MLNIAGRPYTPFFPAQEFPESEIPYIRYGLNNNIMPNTPWMNDAEVFMFVWFDSLDKTQAFANIVYEMCAFGHESAGELMRWIKINNIDCPYIYHSITMPMSGEVQPTTERGGASQFAITLRCVYSPRYYRDRYDYARNS